MKMAYGTLLISGLSARNTRKAVVRVMDSLREKRAVIFVPYSISLDFPTLALLKLTRRTDNEFTP